MKSSSCNVLDVKFHLVTTCNHAVQRLPVFDYTFVACVEFGCHGFAAGCVEIASRYALRKVVNNSLLTGTPSKRARKSPKTSVRFNGSRCVGSKPDAITSPADVG